MPGDSRVPFPRSLLFVPANQSRLLARAWSAGAEALVLDLEDGVPPAEKEAGRDALRRLDPPATWTGPIFVRVNGFDTPEFEADVRAVAGSRVHGCVLPKAERVEAVRRAAAALEATTSLILLIETARGVLHAAELADSGLAGLAALAFGAEDYRASLDAGLSPDPVVVDFARVTIAAAAAAAGVPAVDAPELDVRDFDHLRAATRRARSLGFRAKFAIHPSQIATIHEALGGPAAERAWAARVVAAYERAVAEGRGAVSLDGRMIDAATLRRARNLASQPE